VLIYDGFSAVGEYPIKLAKLSNLKPIIAAAGSNADFAKSLGADYLIDYREKNAGEDINGILESKMLKQLHGFDVGSERQSWEHIAEVVEKRGPKVGKITYNGQSTWANGRKLALWYRI
jgi:NADPH:quinone reductase-like Zn-dependent oxidoreductase